MSAATLGHILFGATMLMVTVAFTPETAYAPPEQRCNPGGDIQPDMEGIYIAEDLSMRADLCADGMAIVKWENPGNRAHLELVVTTQRIPEQGVIGRVIHETAPVLLDDSLVVGFKAGDPGYIELHTRSQTDGRLRFYRLRKVS